MLLKTAVGDKGDDVRRVGAWQGAGDRGPEGWFNGSRAQERPLTGREVFRIAGAGKTTDRKGRVLGDRGRKCQRGAQFSLGQRPRDKK